MKASPFHPAFLRVPAITSFHAQAVAQIQSFILGAGIQNTAGRIHKLSNKIPLYKIACNSE
jgi:hypothetical protein